MMSASTCADVREIAPEFALALLDGTDRAAVIAHLDGCDECRAIVLEYREMVDAVMAAVPAADPAPGFAQRVLDRIGPQVVTMRARPARRLRPALAWVGAAAAAAALVLALVFTNTGSSSTGVAMRSGSLVDAAGIARGEAYLAGGSHPWLFMQVQLPSGGYATTSSYSCQLVLDDGRTVALGTFIARGGVGEWGGSVDVVVGHVVAAELRSTGGELLAEARLH